MKWMIQLGGLLHLALAVFHLLFPRLFNWAQQLPKLDYTNRSILQLVNLFLTFCFIIFALTSLLFAEELLASALGRFLLAALACFWLVRALVQPFYFSLKNPLSAALFLFFVSGSLLYALPLIWPLFIVPAIAG